MCGYVLDMITVLGISGSMRWGSHTHTMLDIALGAARESGARVEVLDVRELNLPIFDPRAEGTSAVAAELRERVADAHAYLVGSPEYHGGASGALKNLFDYLYPEVNGKLFGFAVAAGNDLGTSALAQLREMATYLRAWVLPYGAQTELADFDQSGHLLNERARDRLLRLGRDVAVYGSLLYAQFRRDSIPGGGAHLGFAPWHARD